MQAYAMVPIFAEESPAIYINNSEQRRRLGTKATKKTANAT